VSGERRSDLAAAALALDEELERVEALAAAAARVPLTSERNLERAARTVNEAAQAQQRVGERIQTLVAALNTARERNEATVAALSARGAEVQQRHDELGALLQRFEALGQEAREISGAAQEISASAAAQPDETVARLHQIEARMGGVVDGARALAEAADAAGLDDLARQADGLRQQVLAARNKVGLLGRKLAERLAKPN
jgi:chromosome segregation ATPase